tara:strand:- start:1106 stop:1360 length:255 start_codon:yes stop_codon:yes gene_type:complete
MFTAEQIDNQTRHIESPDAQVEAMKAIFLEQDDSSRFPINGRFNATERAFANIEALEEANGPLYGLEFSLSVEREISEIVNAEL